MRTRHRPRIELGCACALSALATLLVASGARAQDDHWAIDRFAVQEVSPATASTFSQLLRNQITTRNGARFTDLNAGCSDLPCARGAAAPSGARVVVFGSLGRLGSKVVVALTAAQVADGRVLLSETLSVDRVEELDIAAKRLAEALVSGRGLEQSAELGTITHEEAKAPVRRDTRFGVGLNLEGVLPTRGFADRALGAGFGLGLWFETMDFVIEPKLGYRSELGAGDRDWDHGVLEVGASYLMSRGDLSPLIGAGVGLHYMNEELPVGNEVGSVLVSTSEDVIEDDVFGFALFGRVGLLLLRTYDVSLLVALDYTLAFADFQERSDEQAFRLVVGVVIGGT
jgi:hypothetical protein